jgi:uncharacterized protein (DUF488 family)
MSNYVATIGFSKKSLREFVELLKMAKITHLIDTRINNTSQLSGFSKKGDLEYIMGLVGIDYSHDITLAPTQKLLSGYRKKHIGWDEYEVAYNRLLAERKIERHIEEYTRQGICCFLCSENKPNYCHRRLLVEYLQQFDPGLQVLHLH